jgi:hypothetical protein
MWTLDELVERVRRALAAEYPGAPNGRVRDLPDRRAIRWYTTTGLVDRPIGMRGRTALYGSRHLLQLVALKRRQAEGRALAEIQAELAGVADDVLAGVARVPGDLLVMDDGPEPDLPARGRFWAAAPESPAQGPAESPPRSAPRTAPESLGGMALGRGAILVVPGQPTEDERAEIAAAARPLMELLAERGLLKPENGSSS